MSTKTIYCKFGQRCKKIVISAESTLKELTNLFREIVNKDASLKDIFFEKIIIFQKMENNMWIDIEEGDNISDGSEVNVIVMENTISEVIVVSESNILVSITLK